MTNQNQGDFRGAPRKPAICCISVLLGDIVQLARFLRDITASRPKVKTCAGLYDLYRSLGDVIRASSLAVDHYLGVPLDAPFLVGTTSFSSPEAKWASVTNSDFKKLEKAVQQFVAQLRTLRGVFEIYDQQLVNQIEFHFWLKSRWYREFGRLYQAGHIDLQSRRMYTRTLRLAQASEIPPNFRHSSSKVFEQLESVEELDVSGPEAVNRLVEAGQENVQQLEALKAELGEFIKAHCTMETLLASAPSRE